MNRGECIRAVDAWPTFAPERRTIVDIKPAEGYVAVEFLDDEDYEDEDESTATHEATEPMTEKYREVCFAMCIGVGKNVTTCKKGDTVLVRESAREYSIHVGSSTCIVNAYDIVGTVTA